MSCAKGNVRCIAMLSGLARRAANKSRKHHYSTPLSVDSRTVSLTRPVQESEWERTSARPDSQRVTPPLQSGCMRVADMSCQQHATEHARELSAPGTHVTNVSQRAQIRPSPTHQHRSSSALRQPNRFTGPSSIEGQPALFFIGHISPIFARFFSMFSRFSPTVL